MTRLKNANMLLALFLELSRVERLGRDGKNNGRRCEVETPAMREAVDNSINKVGDFMDDSTITARVKAALIDHKDINSGDISVKTESKIGHPQRRRHRC